MISKEKIEAIKAIHQTVGFWQVAGSTALHLMGYLQRQPQDLDVSVFTQTAFDKVNKLIDGKNDYDKYKFFDQDFLISKGQLKGVDIDLIFHVHPSGKAKGARAIKLEGVDKQVWLTSPFYIFEEKTLLMQRLKAKGKEKEAQKHQADFDWLEEYDQYFWIKLRKYLKETIHGEF